jgi:hypothetical protein
MFLYSIPEYPIKSMQFVPIPLRSPRSTAAMQQCEKGKAQILHMGNGAVAKVVDHITCAVMDTTEVGGGPAVGYAVGPHSEAPMALIFIHDADWQSGTLDQRKTFGMGVLWVFAQLQPSPQPQFIGAESHTFLHFPTD